MTQTCPQCGAQLRVQARYCPQCGHSLQRRLVPGAPLKGGDYVVARSLTKGGMGAVYLAHDRRAFDRLCVIKQMLDYYDSANPNERANAQRRFEEEGRTLASLSHPGIPRIYAFFSEGGRHYIVMEYIQGETLEHFVTHETDAGAKVPARRLPQEEVLRYIIQACRILEYLHNQSRPVVHQDIKPANLIVESQLGHVRLVDFGTARAEIPQAPRPAKGNKDSIYGTDGYAPPEQYRGKAVPKSDVFSLAATAYHVLTDDDPRGHPFKWPELDRLPKELAAALRRALRTDPKQRSSATELMQALEALATPTRLLEAFTFPGGSQIRSVGALPTLCDENWDAARSFLYGGDFTRWLRDINRLDLVIAADETVKQWTNHDQGLESFLRIVDPGLPEPEVAIDPVTVDLGAVARESALVRRVTVLNVRRGYVHAEVSSSEPWIEVYPTKLNLWAGIPVDIRINIRAESLPFRARQQGVVVVSTNGHNPLQIPVSAQVSLMREVWRIIKRAFRAAWPESWHTIKGTWRALARVAGAIGRPMTRHTWIPWLLWLVAGAAVGVGLYTLPDWGASLLSTYGVPRPQYWFEYAIPIILGPPFAVSILWLVIVFVLMVLSALFGALRGAWRSFFR